MGAEVAHCHTMPLCPALLGALLEAYSIYSSEPIVPVTNPAGLAHSSWM